MARPKVADKEEWIKERKKLLALEKEFDRERDRLTAVRMALPMVKVDTNYEFEAAQGTRTLADLFDGRRQLIVYHLMYEPTRNAACKHCSCVMDNLVGSLVHLSARDTSFAAISRAPIEKLESFKKRMGWSFVWVSSFRNDFNYDFQITLDPIRGQTTYNYRQFDFQGEMPGLSVFLREREGIFHTYSTYFRGLDMLLPMYHLLDRTPLGRQETKSNSMAAGEASWIRHHDSYSVEAPGSPCCHEK